MTNEEILSLGMHGYFIRDAFLPMAQAEAAEEYASGMIGALAPAGIGRDGRRDTTVRGDLTAWLDDSPLHAPFSSLMEELNLGAWLGLRGFQVQLACYPGGGAHYDRHVDAHAGTELRRVTALLYLNKGWRPDHGGQLRLHVDPPLDVPPELNRLVVFLSEKVHHEVLPSFAQRLAVTAWYHAR